VVVWWVCLTFCSAVGALQMVQLTEDEAFMYVPVY
jgi:hypothetical protein